MSQAAAVQTPEVLTSIAEELEHAGALCDRLETLVTQLVRASRGEPLAIALEEAQTVDVLTQHLAALAGFTPRRSVVLLPFHGRRTHGAMRMDLPDPDTDPDAFAEAGLRTLLQVSGRQQVPLFRQVAPAAHGPQLAQPPHPSGHVPHCTPICEQVFGVQGTHWFPWQALPAEAFDLRTQVTFGGHGFVVTRLSTGIRVGGAVELGGLKLPPNFRRSEAMLEKARAFLPGLKPEGGVQWMGFRPSLPDSLPAIGRARATPDVVYAFGHGHLGLTQSAGTARLVADLLTDERTAIDIASFSPQRF